MKYFISAIYSTELNTHRLKLCVYSFLLKLQYDIIINQMENKQQNVKQPTKAGENADNNGDAKSITNICYDCIERIFDFLDLESLLNVANTCK